MNDHQKDCFSSLDIQIASLYGYLLDNFYNTPLWKEMQKQFDDLAKVVNKLEESLT